MKTRQYKGVAVPVFSKIEDAVAQLKLDKLPTIEPMKVTPVNFPQNVTLLLSEGNYTSGTTAILARDGS